MSQYEPEIGQMLFGRPTSEYEVPDFAEACFNHARRELGRHWNNVYASEPNEQGEYAEFAERGFYPPDHQPFGVTYRAYNWDEDAPDEPNFAWDGLEIRWYKYPGRGMSCNVDWTPQQWADWLNKFMRYFAKLDQDWFAKLMAEEREARNG